MWDYEEWVESQKANGVEDESELTFEEFDTARNMWLMERMGR